MRIWSSQSSYQYYELTGENSAAPVQSKVPGVTAVVDFVYDCKIQTIIDYAIPNLGRCSQRRLQIRLTMREVLGVLVVAK